MIGAVVVGVLAGLVLRELQGPPHDLWCARYGRDRRVLAWLRENPPPAEWQESPAAWAWLEMFAPLGLGEPQIDADAPAALPVVELPAAAPEADDQAPVAEPPAEVPAQLELPALELPELAAELPAAPVRARKPRKKAAAAPVADGQAPAVESPAGEKGGAR
jgi:hypothetical protein